MVTHSECDTVLFGSNNIALTGLSGSDREPGMSDSEDESSSEETSIVHKPPSEEGGVASQEPPDTNSAGGEEADGAPMVCSDQETHMEMARERVMRRILKRRIKIAEAAAEQKVAWGSTDVRYRERTAENEARRVI